MIIKVGIDTVTIAEAIEKAKGIEEAVCIHIPEGRFEEKICIDVNGITLKGAGDDKTLIYWADSAKMEFPNGEKYRTFHSYSVFVPASNVRIEDLTIENGAGKGCDVGQAVALYAEGDCFHMKNVKLLGNQDTLFTGPLPRRPIEGKDFGGPMEGKERVVGRQFYEHCRSEERRVGKEC